MHIAFFITLTLFKYIVTWRMVSSGWYITIWPLFDYFRIIREFFQEVFGGLEIIDYLCRKLINQV